LEIVTYLKIITLENYNIALKNDSNNYLYLKNCAYSYEKNRDYSKALKMLDELLKINMVFMLLWRNII
jgi:tetratricopeptide (TPR) repeat protein